MREKSSNLVDVWAESAAKHGPPLRTARAIQRASCRRPLKRNDFQLYSAFRFSVLFAHEKRHPSRIGSGTGFFGIMLWRERHNAAFTINEEQSAVALADCGRSAIRTAINRLCHIMLPYFHGESAPARGGKASPSSTCPCEPKPSATPSRGHLFCQARISRPLLATCCGRPRRNSALRSETRAPSST